MTIFSNCKFADNDPCSNLLKYKLSKSRKVEINIFNIITKHTDIGENYLKCLTEPDKNRWQELATPDVLLSADTVSIFRNQICNKPTMSPTSDPTMDPTLDPTTDPTKDPTNNPTPYPTRMKSVVKKAIMVLDKVFDKLHKEEDELLQWAFQFITNITNIQNDPTLKELIIEIVRVRKGSVIIEYSIETKALDFIDIAMD
eukprot:470381_1